MVPSGKGKEDPGKGKKDRHTHRASRVSAATTAYTPSSPTRVETKYRLTGFEGDWEVP